MKTKIKTEALIIKEQKVKENDRLITLLTKDKGILKAFAGGALKLSSKHHAATGFLTYSSVLLVQSKDTYRVTESEPINLFYDLRNSIETLSLAGYFCELAVFLAPTEEDAEVYLRLLLNAFHLLCEKKRSIHLVKAVTELRMASLHGYMPDLQECNNCGEFKDVKMNLHLLEGNILCDNCTNGERIKLSEGLLAALRHIIYADDNKIFSFSLSDEGLKALSDITEMYIKTQIGRHFDTLDFFKSVMSNYTT